LPKDIVAKLQAESVKVLAQQETKDRMAVLGFDAKGSTPEEFARYIDTEMARYAKIVKDANIKAE
jgi:tripartite-type tricarboxylate transporter receptor subunit TctC